MDKNQIEYLRQMTPIIGFSRALRNLTYLEKPCLLRDFATAEQPHNAFLYGTLHLTAIGALLETAAKSLESLINHII